MGKSWLIRTATTGGGANALDGKDGDDLNDGDLGFVFDSSSRFLAYELDASSGAAEDDPYVIAPDTNPGSKRWILHDTYAINAAYTSTMSGDETFTQKWPDGRKNILDPNGADRNFNPSGSFTTGYLAWVWNTGTTYNLVFDSAASAQTITPGTFGVFVYDGTIWR